MSTIAAEPSTASASSEKPASHTRMLSEPGEGTPRRRRRSSAAASSTHSRSSSASSILSHEPPSPSHPANVFRNLLIMEESLRVEYVQIRYTRRKYTLFVVLLIASTLYFAYTVFIDPSIYRVIHFFNRLFLMISLVTIVLFYISGSYTKTLVHSRKFIHNTNKGLREFNVKLVKIPPAWMESLIDVLWSPAYSNRPGRVVKIVLSPRAFNPDTVEGWEIYRQEYWNREYDRLTRKPVAGAASYLTSTKVGAHRRADSRSMPGSRRPASVRALRASVDLAQGEVTPRPRKKTVSKSNALSGSSSTANASNSRSGAPSSPPLKPSSSENTSGTIPT